MRLSSKLISGLICLFFIHSVFADVIVEEVAGVDSSNQAGWWVPLAIHDGDAYFSFNSSGSTNSKHKVKVAKRSSSGVWVSGFLKNADGSIWEHSDDNGHDQPTIAVDGDGDIHVFADHHNNNWRYFRSSSPTDVNNLLKRSDMVNNTGIYTYPVAATSENGDIYLIVRDTNGSDIGKGQLFYWNNNTDVWSHIGTFASQTNTRVYPDDLVVDSNGDVHIIWEWAYGHPRADRHYGSYLKYEPNTGLFKTANGSTVSAPVNLSTPNLFYQGLESGESFTSSDTGKGIQSAKIALGSTGRPSVVYRFRTDGASSGGRDYEVFRIRWNGTSWVDKTSIYSAQETIAALGHTIVGNRVRAYFVSNDKQLYVAEKTGSSAWASYILSNDKSIERVNVKVKETNEDIVYASAPTSVSSNSGKLYAFFVDSDLTDIPEPVVPTIYEAEDLYFTNTVTVTVLSDVNASEGKYVMLQDNTVNDWIEFTLPNVEVGTYTVKYSYKTHSTRGIATTGYEGNDFASSVDQYNTGVNWPLAILGTINVSTAGDKLLRFTVTGQNPSSSGYKISIDKIVLE
ncbi:BNR-4 repeat-containing protein [Alteromonas sp. 1_MG-2023]|uniref:BNR-4 repeat-containing protein n=1 Tax=Alteromonas sp. 1_MG-2023 TaxID=3062669 RepID=UPI0026E3EA39|nr:BNR-4 repeat-containing protein [Alteromonas sp. 1_MG-2023]MDO6566513.1 BNR-4 repeat-containing protein [Alteromonas sp. 1_MG-2023]